MENRKTGKYDKMKASIKMILVKTSAYIFLFVCFLYIVLSFSYSIFHTSNAIGLLAFTILAILEFIVFTIINRKIISRVVSTNGIKVMERGLAVSIISLIISSIWIDAGGGPEYFTPAWLPVYLVIMIL